MNLMFWCRRQAWRAGQHLTLLSGLGLLIPPYSSIDNKIIVSSRSILLGALFVALSRFLAIWCKERETWLDAILTVIVFLCFALVLKLRLSCL